MHLDPVRFVALLALGLLYAWLAWRSGSLWPAVVAHVVNNALGVMLAAASPGESSLREAHARPLELVLASAITLSITAGVLQLAAAAYRRPTPAPPTLAEALARRRAADRSTAFHAARVPRPLLAAVAVGVASLMVLLAAVRHGR